MPHYADGTEAKVGDQVTGKLYNSEGIKAGVIISITPDQDTCNAMVQFTEAFMYGGPEDVPRMALRSEAGPAAPRTVQALKHGTEGPLYQLWTCADYAEIKALTKVG